MIGCGRRPYQSWGESSSFPKEEVKIKLIQGFDISDMLQLRPSDRASGSTAVACVVQPGEGKREEEEADRVGGGRKEGGGGSKSHSTKKNTLPTSNDCCDRHSF